MMIRAKISTLSTCPCQKESSETCITIVIMMILIQATEDSFWQGQVERAEILALVSAFQI